MRFNYYPQLEDTKQVKPGQLRCGEHTDYGALTLLFQDQCGGLEVLSPEGEYMPATPIEGSIIVNIADIMQRWTSDKLISAVRWQLLLICASFISFKVFNFHYWNEKYIGGTAICWDEIILSGFTSQVVGILHKSRNWINVFELRLDYILSGYPS